MKNIIDDSIYEKEKTIKNRFINASDEYLSENKFIYCFANENVLIKHTRKIRQDGVDIDLYLFSTKQKYIIFFFF